MHEKPWQILHFRTNATFLVVNVTNFSGGDDIFYRWTFFGSHSQEVKNCHAAKKTYSLPLKNVTVTQNVTFAIVFDSGWKPNSNTNIGKRHTSLMPISFSLKQTRLVKLSYSDLDQFFLRTLNFSSRLHVDNHTDLNPFVSLLQGCSRGTIATAIC